MSEKAKTHFLTTGRGFACVSYGVQVGSKFNKNQNRVLHHNNNTQFESRASASSVLLRVDSIATKKVVGFLQIKGIVCSYRV